jgi:hypothetical protein
LNCSQDVESSKQRSSNLEDKAEGEGENRNGAEPSDAAMSVVPTLEGFNVLVGDRMMNYIFRPEKFSDKFLQKKNISSGLGQT